MLENAAGRTMWWRQNVLLPARSYFAPAGRPVCLLLHNPTECFPCTSPTLDILFSKVKKSYNVCTKSPVIMMYVCAFARTVRTYTLITTSSRALAEHNYYVDKVPWLCHVRKRLDRASLRGRPGRWRERALPCPACRPAAASAAALATGRVGCGKFFLVSGILLGVVMLGRFANFRNPTDLAVRNFSTFRYWCRYA